jgi:hypothetical protein
MSYAQLHGLTGDGELVVQSEYKNAHGWVAFVWDMLCEKHNVDGMYYGQKWERLWAQAQTLPLTAWERNVLMASYDWAAIEREYFGVLADSLEKFEEAYNTGQRVCHLTQMAKDLRELGDEVVAVCWYNMSVSEDLWFNEPDPDDGDERVQYRFETGTKHTFHKLSPLTEETTNG